MNNIENLILNTDNISKAIKILDEIKYKTLIVIDKNKKLFGTLTDGDIRRGLLKGITINKKIAFVANATPQKKIIGNKHTRIISNEERIVLPYVDKNNKLVDIKILKKKGLLKKKYRCNFNGWWIW